MSKSFKPNDTMVVHKLDQDHTLAKGSYFHAGYATHVASTERTPTFIVMCKSKEDLDVLAKQLNVAPVDHSKTQWALLCKKDDPTYKGKPVKLPAFEIDEDDDEL